MYTDFYVDKTSQTFADTLVAFGLARVLADLLERQGARGQNIPIRDNGPYYHLICEPGVEFETLEELYSIPLCPIRAISTDYYSEDKLPESIPFIKWSDISLYFQALKQKTSPENLPARPPHLDILLAINPAAIQGYNGLLFDWWTVRESQPEVMFLLLNLYAATPNKIEPAVAEWKQLSRVKGWKVEPLTTGQQLYNPDQGMGQNHPKANKLNDRDKPKVNFWLTEWLRAVGFYEAAITQLVGDEKKKASEKDRKTLVVASRNIGFADNQVVMNRFREAMSDARTSILFDVLAAIRYTRTLLLYFNESDRKVRLQRLGKIKKTLVAGFYTVFYKNLGRASSTMNIAFIALPGWIEINSAEEVSLYRGLLDELETLTRQFDESHSDAFNLLQHLRDFVSGDNLDAFFRFTNAFPAYYMGMKQRGKYAYSLSTSFIERLVMSTDERLSPILESEGFQNIAYAIRQSTVIAQYWTQEDKKRGGRYPYDIRYGLGQELSRRARNKKEFLADLTGFLQKYSAETAQVEELMRKRDMSFPFSHQRKQIKTSDIDDIMRLIDEFGSETVANLLIAYGYARMPREDAFDNETEQESNQ